jgi:signal transduction histidine kinase
MRQQQRRPKFRSSLIFITIFVVAMLFLGWFFIRLVHSTRLNIISEMRLELARVERGFVDRIDHTYSIIKNLNHQIAQNPRSKYHINKILSSYKTAPNLNNSFSWTAFSWVDDNYHLTVDADDGIIKEYLDVSIRDYVHMTERDPGKFYLGTPGIGVNSKEWIIPGGVGLTDKNGRYLGATVIGFKIGDLTKILRKVVQHHEIGFKLFSKNGAYILHGNSKSHEARDSQDDSTNNIKLEKIFNEINTNKGSSFSSISLLRDPHALLAKKLDDHPYIIVTFYNQDALLSEFMEVLSSSLTEVLSILFSFIVLFILVHRELRQTKALFRMKLSAERANNSKAEFLTRAAHEFKNFIFGIHGCAEIIRDDLRRALTTLKAENNTKNLHRLQDLETDLELSQNIIETSHDLDSFINELMELNSLRNNDLKIKASPYPIDLKQAFQSVLPTLKKSAKSADVILIVEIDKNLHKLPNLDPKRLKQIIAGLVSNAIKYSEAHTVVAISIKNIEDQNILDDIYKVHGIKKSKAVEILIKDQNSHVNPYEMKSTLNSIKNLKKFDIFSTKLPAIKFLIEKQDGIFEIRADRKTGNETKIIF